LKQLLALSASVLLLLLDHNVVLQCEGVDFGYGATRSRGALWRLRDWGRHLTAHSLPKQPVNSQAID